MILDKLLARGDTISVERGRLVIRPSSGLPVPDAWIQQHGRQLIVELARSVGVEARTLRYDGYSTGHYGPHKTEGVTLRFVDMETGELLYCVFNVELRRDRTTKHGVKGSPLTPGHFRAPARGEFLKFWQRCGQALPRRASAIHEYMGNLKSVVLVGEIQSGDRLIKTSIRMAEMTDNSRTSHGQLTDKPRTRVTDKESAQAQQPRGIQPNRTTCVANYENKLTRRHVNTGSQSFDNALNDPETPEPKKPEDQTLDEWLADYSS